MGRPVCLAVAWAVWAVWTIKPTLSPNDEGPGFLSGLLSCAAATEKRIGLHGAKKCISNADKKPAELSLLFLRENRVPVILISFRRVTVSGPRPCCSRRVRRQQSYASTPEALLSFGGTSFLGAELVLIFLSSLAIVFPNADLSDRVDSPLNFIRRRLET